MGLRLRASPETSNDWKQDLHAAGCANRIYLLFKTSSSLKSQKENPICPVLKSIAVFV